MPEAILPIFETQEANSSVLLYEGQVTVSQGSTSASSHGRISLDWLPSPALRFQLSELSQDTLGNDIHQKKSLVLDDGTLVPDLLVTKITVGAESASISGFINGNTIKGQNLSVAEARFIVCNLPPVLGTAVTFPDGSAWRGRIQLAARGWALTLDPVPNQKGLINAIEACSGFGITYSGRICKEDGSHFTRNEAEDFMEAFSWYSSFAIGRRVGVLLSRGIDASGVTVWEGWSDRKVDPYSYCRSWVACQSADIFQDPFHGFVELWFDPDWNDELLTVIQWYLAANSLSGGIEGSIVQTQTAFELLSSAILVEQTSWLSADGLEKLPVADRIRLLLHWAGIPTSIPNVLSDLLAHARAENLSDTAQAMTAIRNAIIHPTKKNLAKIAKSSFETRFNTWDLGLWNLELCLLRLFKYNGKYANRLTRKWAHETESVPWAI